MNIPRSGPSYLDNQTEDDGLAAPLPHVLQGGLVKMGVLVVTTPTPVTPVLLSATPADNTGAVGVSNDIVLHFNTAVQAGSGSIVISDGHTQSYIDGSGALASRIVGATDTRSLSLSDPQVSIVGNDVTIRLSTPLKAGTGYSVTMAAGVLTDTSSSHLAYAGLANTSVLNFTTSAAHAAPTAAVNGIIDFTDTGIDSDDYITNSAAQTLQGTYSGTLQAGDFVQVSLDNGASWHLANSNASNHTWSYSGSSISASSTMLARISNAYGLNSGTLSQAYTYSTGTPSAYASNLAFSDDTGSSSVDRITSVAAQTISGTVVGTLAAGEHVQLSLDNGASWHVATLNGAGTSWSYAAILNAGTNLLRVQVADVAGNAYEGSQYSYSLHTSAYNLAAANITLAASSDTNIVGDNITKAATKITVSGLGNGGLHVGDTINIIDQSNGNAIVGSYTLTSSNLDHYGNGILDNGEGGALTSWDVNVTGLNEGSHTLVAQVVDALAGLTGSASHAVTIKVDTVAANLTSVTHIDGDNNASTPDDIVLTFNEAIDIHANGGFLVTNSDTSVYATLNVSSPDQVTVAGNTVTLHLSGVLDASASYTIIQKTNAAITDIAGNIVPYQSAANTIARFQTDSGSHVVSTAIISAPPTASILGPLTLSDDSGDSSSDFVTNVAAQTISGQYTGTLVGDQTVQVSTDGGVTWHNATHVDAVAQNWSYAGTLLAGNYTMAARVADSGGVTTTPVYQEYTYDNVAPAASLTPTGESLSLHLSVAAAVHLSPEYSHGPEGTDLTSDSRPDLAVNGLKDLRLAVGDFVQLIEFQDSSKVLASYQVKASDLDHYGGMVNDVVTLHMKDGFAGEGNHYVQVRVGDLAGNASAASAVTLITVDSTAPDADIHSATLQLAAGQDTGSDDHDNIININKPHLSADLTGVSGLKAGDILKIYDGEGMAVAEHAFSAGELNGSGQFTAHQLDLAVTVALSDYPHNLRMQLEDLAGNHGSYSENSLYLTVDTCAPSAPEVTVGDGGIVMPSEPGDIVLHFAEDVVVSNDFVVVIVNADDPLDSNSASFSHDGDTVTIHIADTLDPDSHYVVNILSGKITDVAGNSAYSISQVTDFYTGSEGHEQPPYTEPPSGMELADDTASATSMPDHQGELTDHITSNGVVHVNGLSHGDVQWRYSISSINNGAYVDGDSDGNGFILPEGVYLPGSIQVVQSFAWQDSTPVTNAVTWVVDNTPFDAYVDPLATSVFASGVSQLISGKFTGGTSAQEEIVELSFDHGATWVRSSPPVYSGSDSSWSATGNVSDMVGVRISDAAGNISPTFANGQRYGTAPMYFGSSNGSTYTVSNNSVIYGGSGNDTFNVAATDLQNEGFKGMLAGGGGNDILALRLDTFQFDLGSYIKPGHLDLHDIATIQLSGDGSLHIGAASDFAALAGAQHELTIITYGSAVDIALGAGNWQLDGTVGSLTTYHDTDTNLLTLHVQLIGTA